MTKWTVAACLVVLAVNLSAAQAGRTLPPKQDDSDARPWPDAEAIEADRQAADARPLFASDDVLSFALVADFGQVQGDRDVDGDKLYSGTIVLGRGTASEQSIPIRLRTRGHSRLRPDFCTFAPLRLRFDTNPVGTVFDGQKSLKLGVHCRDAGDYPEYVMREYPVYRMMNLISPNSFRARAAEVTYVDAKNGKTFVRGGLLIENDDDMARRLGGRISESTGEYMSQLNGPATSAVTMFEYMIGNTDVSIRSLHNMRMVLKPDGVRIPVPYDFDYSGVVNASYALPHPLLPISTVRQRLYLGPCQTPPVLKVFLSRFHSSREALLAVYDTAPMLNQKYRDQAKRYLEGFFRGTADDKGAKRAFIDGCGSRAYF